MAIKIYSKRGNLNYKERKFVTKIEEALAKKMLKDPSIESRFRPATNFEELKTLHETYCVEDVAFEEVPNSRTASEKDDSSYDDDSDNEALNNEMEEQFNGNASATKSNAEKIQEELEFQESKTTRKLTDPLNREEPIVRDYVLGTDQSSQRETIKTGPERVDFDEPISFNDSFEIPRDEDLGDNGKVKQLTQGSDNGSNNSSSNSSNVASTNNNNGGSSSGQRRSDPINPNFDEMSSGKKRKSTKRFAKSIVNTVCMLSSKGFEWYANKDINDAKLIEYEINNEIDLRLIVTLEDGQEATVKQFFQQQCHKATQLSKISQEQKDDLIEALTEVLLEKGVAPTPTQDLIMVSIEIIGGQVVNLIALKSQTNSLLEQLKEMKASQVTYTEESSRTNESSRETERRQEPKSQTEPSSEITHTASTTTAEKISDAEILTPEEEYSLLRETEIETKE